MEKLTQKNESPRLAATSEGSEQSKPKSHNSSVPKKWERVLAAFYRGHSFNRFEAERALNDHCLHSTVSTLQDMGIVIEREFETVPGYRNIPTRVCRYWLNHESKELAEKLLGKKLTRVSAYSLNPDFLERAQEILPTSLGGASHECAG